jgi:hypothetical protein
MKNRTQSNRRFAAVVVSSLGLSIVVVVSALVQAVASAHAYL